MEIANRPCRTVRRLAAFGALAAMLCACSAPPTQQANWTIPPSLKTVAVQDGYPLAYEEAGSGVPVILIHGALTDSRSWIEQVKVLGAKYRVINVNLRHYYPEPWDGKGPGFSFQEQADDIASLIRKLNLGKAHVVGHSRGGAVALQVAMRHPDLVRSLVLADPTGLNSFLSDPAERRKIEADNGALYDRFRANSAKGDRDFAAADFVDTLSGAGTWASRTAEQKQVLFDNFGTALAEDMSTWPAVSCNDAAQLTMPVMLIHGERSPRRYVDTAAALRACKASDWPVKTILGASHIMNRQKPADFNAVVMEFLAQN